MFQGGFVYGVLSKCRPHREPQISRTAYSELELIQSHMAQKPVLRGEVGCACVAREVSSLLP